MSAESPDQLLAKMLRKYRTDPLGFVRIAYPWGTGLLAGVEGPDGPQAEFLRDVGIQVRARNFQFDSDAPDPAEPIKMAMSKGHGTGGAHPKSITINTPAGIARWGDLRAGDTVFGGDGKPVAVEAVHEQGAKPVYQVTFDDGTVVLCDLGHKWNVRGRRERRRGLDGWRTLTVDEILEIGVKRPNGVARACQWEVPIQGAAEFDAREIDLHPYFVGLWLGDGKMGQPEYCKPFPELAERLRSLGMNVSDKADGMSHRVLGVTHMFTDQVFRCYSEERYIPDDYKFQSADNRRELLRGLMDSDGECCGPREASIGYSSASKRLAEDVMWLVRSLGGKAQLCETPKKCHYTNRTTGERIPCLDSWRVTIQIDWNPFTLEHRRARWRPCEKRYITRWIESIEYSHDEECSCITVAAEDGLYLANDFIVTHNSTMTAWLADWLMSTWPGSIGTVTAGTATQLEERTWAAVQTWTAMCITAHWFDVQTAGMYAKPQFCGAGVTPESWKVLAYTCKAENYQSFAGQHARTSASWYQFDEASEVPDLIWDTAMGGLTDGQPMFFAWGQCVRNSGRFFQVCFGDLQKYWNTRTVDSRQSRWPNKPEIARWLEQYGEDSDIFRVRVLGLAPRASELQFIDWQRIRDAGKRLVTTFPDDPLIVGVDCSDGGGAWNIARFRRGFDARSIPPIRIPGEQTRNDPHVLTARLAEALRDPRPERRISAMFIDAAFGAHIAQRLQDMGYKQVHTVRFGGASPDPDCKNWRAAMYKAGKDWLLLGAIPDEADDKPLANDLAGPGYHLNESRKLVIESKADMAKRRVKSPDDGDAFMLTFAQPVAQSVPAMVIPGQGLPYSQWASILIYMLPAPAIYHALNTCHSYVKHLC